MATGSNSTSIENQEMVETPNWPDDKVEERSAISMVPLKGIHEH